MEKNTLIAGYLVTIFPFFNNQVQLSKLLSQWFCYMLSKIAERRSHRLGAWRRQASFQSQSLGPLFQIAGHETVCASLVKKQNKKSRIAIVARWEN